MSLGAVQGSNHHEGRRNQSETTSAQHSSTTSTTATTAIAHPRPSASPQTVEVGAMGGKMGRENNGSRIKEDAAAGMKRKAPHDGSSTGSDSEPDTKRSKLVITNSEDSSASSPPLSPATPPSSSKRDNKAEAAAAHDNKKVISSQLSKTVSIDGSQPPSPFGKEVVVVPDRSVSVKNDDPSKSPQVIYSSSKSHRDINDNNDNAADPLKVGSDEDKVPNSITPNNRGSAVENVTVVWERVMPMVECSESKGPPEVVPAGFRTGADCVTWEWKTSAPKKLGLTNAEKGLLRKSSSARYGSTRGGSTKEKGDSELWRRYEEVHYDPNRWQLNKGRLIRRPDAQKASLCYDVLPHDLLNNKRIRKAAVQVQSSTQQAPKPKPKTNTAKNNQAPRRSRNRTKREVSPNKKSSRVGANYQAVIPPRPMTQYAFDKSVYVPVANKGENFTGDVIWDPLLAQEASHNGQDLARFIGNNNEFSTTMLKLEALSRANYNTKNAKRELEDLEMHQTSSVLLDEIQKPEFENIIKKGKDFTAICKLLGISKSAALVNYYGWKGRCKADYEELKGKRKVEPEYCKVCDDGGTLIVCELCRDAYHLDCLNPPLSKAPPGDWYCTKCLRQTPAKTRRLPSGGRRLDTTPHENYVPKTPSTELSEAKRFDIVGVHKELFTPVKLTAQKQPRSPSKTDTPGVQRFWDPEREVWVQLQGALSTPLASPTPVEDTPDDVDSDESHSDESEEEVEPTPKKGKARRKIAEAHDSESDFDPAEVGEDDDDDDEDYLDYEDRNKKAREQAKSSRMPAKPVASSAAHSSTAVPNVRVPSSTPKFVEYEIDLPKTSEGYLIKLASRKHIATGNDTVFFNGYTKTRAGEPGPAERANLFKGVFDRFIMVDGISCKGKTFEEIKSLLKTLAPGKTTKRIRLRHDPSGDGTLASAARNPAAGTVQRQVSAPRPAPQNYLPVNVTAAPHFAPPQAPIPHAPYSSVSHMLPSSNPQEIPLQGGGNVNVVGGMIGTARPQSYNVVGGQQQQQQQPRVVQRPQQPAVVQQRQQAYGLVKPQQPQMEPRLKNIFSDFQPFLTFLCNCGIRTCADFCMADSDILAQRWATFTSSRPQNARDYIGAMKFHFSQNANKF